jgi:hypothetical protein
MATDYVALYRSLLKRPSISERETIVPTDQVGMNNAARLRETDYVAEVPVLCERVSVLAC